VERFHLKLLHLCHHISHAVEHYSQQLFGLVNNKLKHSHLNDGVGLGGLWVCSLAFSGTVVVMIVWWLDKQLPVKSVPITTKAVSSNPVHGEVYLIQHYVIKFVTDLRQVGGFL
jgi:hypothetical protein